ncbi:calmodulin-binding receptor-like cytoplasmic kinase 2 [Quercus suber]|uniref:Calmodulin-binding receptor-like cytoplasmic kinase 2 n=1 Tax=Quercus suber TaxID=58331 RepID=A0AAW0L0V5_QUESU
MSEVESVSESELLAGNSDEMERMKSGFVLSLHIGVMWKPQVDRSKNRLFGNNNSDSSSPTDSEERNVSDASRTGRERKRGSNRGVNDSANKSTHGREVESVKFNMEEILKATGNFSPSFKIGQGGSGKVFKWRLKDGTLVASVYDKHLEVEFQSEIQTLVKIEHLNLVKFYGYLEQGDEKIVVLEYVPNGTLREHLDCIRGNILSLAARLDIGIAVAHAITYLHMYTVQAMKKFTDGEAISTLDPKLACDSANILAVDKIVELALQCLAPRRQNRPSMRRCAEILWRIRKEYREALASHVSSLSSYSMSTSIREH